MTESLLIVLYLTLTPTGLDGGAPTSVSGVSWPWPAEDMAQCRAFAEDSFALEPGSMVDSDFAVIPLAEGDVWALVGCFATEPDQAAAPEPVECSPGFPDNGVGPPTGIVCGGAAPPPN